jgi:hemerythrin-like domain-containing protein
MDANLQLVQNAVRAREALELLLRAVAHARRHFDREERVVFPMAERVLNERTLNELGEAWMEQRTQAPVAAQ